MALRVGSGSDTILADASSGGTFLVTDFDPADDFLKWDGVMHLSDLDTLTQTDEGVKLVKGDLTITLLDVTAAQLIDGVFVDYLV